MTSQTPFYLHQSDLKLVWECPRKFYYHRLLGLRPKQRPVYFDAGSAYHKAIALYRHPLNQKVEATERLWKIQSIINNEYGTVLSEENLESVHFWIDRFASTHDPQQYGEIIAIEKYVQTTLNGWTSHFANIPGHSIVMGGVVDGLSIQHKLLWRIEGKTARSISSTYKSELEQGIQSLIYGWLLDHLLPDLKQLHTIRDVGGTVFEICPKTGKNGLYYTKHVSSVTDRKRAVKFVFNSCSRIASYYVTEDWPQALSACWGKFGQLCGYKSYCWMDEDHSGENVKHLIGNMYEIIDPEEERQKRIPTDEDFDLTKLGETR